MAIEVLSPEDSFSRILLKCRLYEPWGIRGIVVVDPKPRIIWSFKNGAPEETNVIARRGERVISSTELWDEVDRLLKR